jgi:hypothetical protein
MDTCNQGAGGAKQFNAQNGKTCIKELARVKLYAHNYGKA